MSDTKSMQPVSISAPPTNIVEFDSSPIYLCTGSMSTSGSVAAIMSMNILAAGYCLRVPAGAGLRPVNRSTVCVNIDFMSGQYIKHMATSVPKCSSTSNSICPPSMSDILKRF